MQKALDDELMEDDMLPQLACHMLPECIRMSQNVIMDNQPYSAISIYISIYIPPFLNPPLILPVTVSNFVRPPRYTASVRVLAGGEILDAFGFPVGDGSRLPRFLQTSVFSHWSAPSAPVCS